MFGDGYIPIYADNNSNGGYWHAIPGCFYLIDAGAGDVNFKLCSAWAVPPGSSFAAKIINGAGTHNGVFHPWGNELISGLSVQYIGQAGQGRIYTAGTGGWESQ